MRSIQSLAAASLFVLSAALTPAIHAQAPSKELFPDKPIPVPAFSMKTMDGKTITSRDLKGKVAIVNFWATWCAPCKAEMPDLVKLQAKYKNQLVVIGVSEDETAEPVTKFTKEYGINFPIAMATPELRKAFPEWAALPTTFILDREGRIVFQHMGMLDPKLTERQTRVLAGLEVGR